MKSDSVRGSIFNAMERYVEMVSGGEVTAPKVTPEAAPGIEPSSKWYFLNITDADILSELQSQQVTYKSLTVTAPFGETGIYFPCKHLGKVLEVLGVGSVTKAIEVATNIHNVYRVYLAEVAEDVPKCSVQLYLPSWLESRSYEYNKQLKALRVKMTEHDKKVTKLSQSLSTACFDREALVAGYAKLQAQYNYIRESSDPVAQLRGHSNVQDVRVRNQVLEIKTDHVVLGGRRIGRFTVFINPKQGTFRCENRDQKRNGYSHPHVGNDVCFGTAGARILQLIENDQLYTAFCLIWSRLHSYNRHDCYISLKYFKSL